MALALAISASEAAARPDAAAPPPARPAAPSTDTDAASLALALQLQAEEDSSFAASTAAAAASELLAQQLHSQEQQSFSNFIQSNHFDTRSKVQVQYAHPSFAAAAAASPPPTRQLFGADDADEYDEIYGEEDRQQELSATGPEPSIYKMNDANLTAPQFRRSANNADIIDAKTGDKVGSKHDPKLAMKNNGNELLQNANLSSLKDLASLNIDSKTYHKYKNSLKTAKKGVEVSGTGRNSTNHDGGKTHGGGVDAYVARIFQKAINNKVVDEVHGCVKEGKEGVIFYACRTCPPSERWPYTEVAVKVFKRIQDFANRGLYVDGDPRFYKKKFNDYDRRDQISLWTTKVSALCVSERECGAEYWRGVTGSDQQ